MIPKIIHYCWFGKNPLSEMAKKCIKSWNKYCPDYEIIEWNEENFDINYNAYVQEAYEEEKWAFVSDVARLYALVNYGGIYMDIDVEVIKPLDELLTYDAVLGFELETRIQTGFMACRKGQSIFRDFLRDYDNVHFRHMDGSLDTTTNVARVTNICLKYGFKLNNKKQDINGMLLLPREYLCPKNFVTGKVTITNKTICIHYYDGSWLSEEDIEAARIRKKICIFFPEEASGYVAKWLAICKLKGIKMAWNEMIQWIEKRYRKKGL